MTRTKLTILGVLAALAVTLSTTDVVVAGPSLVIDFEGLAEGSFVSSLTTSPGGGISGDVVAGSVLVNGFNPTFPLSNAAMIYDSTCGGSSRPGCTGNDPDLGAPNETFGGLGVGIGGESGQPNENGVTLGNILIISEDLDQGDPDDADLMGAMFDFDFSGFGSGVVTIHTLHVLDVEAGEAAGAKIEMFSGGPGGTLEKTVAIPSTGDNGLATIDVDQSGVDFMSVTLNGSGAVDNINITVEETETCLPCKGGVTELTLRNNSGAAIDVQVYDDKDAKPDKLLFSGTVAADGTFTVFGTGKGGKLSKEISVWVDGERVAKIHTSCSKPIGPGTVFGDFEVTKAVSKDNGLVCPIDDDVAGACETKVQAILLRYTGPDIQGATVVEFDPDKKGLATVVYNLPSLLNGDVLADPGQNGFTIDATAGGGSELGAKTKIRINGVEEVIHTSCSAPFGAGAPAPLDNPKGDPSPNWFVVEFEDK